ncbi:hypothetical protein [Chlorobium phaeovibrioides]|uniref:Uncharacterized protein n=1 Tax=Chlorobium phaeovibrioides TaxID=1094 RepID=A0ABW9UM30_CHLPH|nr:hypothetical protein [Chlorobium phaeovibrioides]MWV54123.1 hypothetical protein [Chlorobium phaeovibrioides]
MTNGIKKSIIFMTGCIDPGGMHMTILTDTAKRKVQYIDAIRFYLNSASVPVLFIENSGNDISSEFRKEINEKTLEIVTFNGNDYDKKKGKGYGEMLIIEEAIRSSSLFDQADFIFKATGRYKVLNIRSFVEFVNEKPDAAELMVNLLPTLADADSRFFGAKRDFFRDFLIGYRSRLNDQDCFYFETALASAVHMAIVDGYRYSGLHHYPRYSAESGTGGGVYNDSWSRWVIKDLLLKGQHRLQQAFKIR